MLGAGCVGAGCVGARDEVGRGIIIKRAWGATMARVSGKVRESVHMRRTQNIE